MAIFHETHIAQMNDATAVLKRLVSGSQALTIAHDFCTGGSEDKSLNNESVTKLLRAELATIAGSQGCNELTDNFARVSKHEIQKLVDDKDAGSPFNVDDAARIYLAYRALQSARDISQHKFDTKYKLYTVEMKMRQASIESLKWTLKIAMYGLHVYLAMLALWLGYYLHTDGWWWRFVVLASLAFYLASRTALRRIADKSIKSAADLLASLSETHA